jgi:glutathione S-transferase
MPLTLYAHPFAAYCWKVLIALYENATPFHYRVIEDPEGWAELATLWPIRKFPLLRDGDTTIVESSVIVEYLMRCHPGNAPMLPADAVAALQVRFMDRFFDNYVMTPMQTLVADRMRPENERDAKSVADARTMLEDWVHPIGARFPGVLAYRRRLLARPSVTRVVEEARPYRKFFPQGAPERD